MPYHTLHSDKIMNSQRYRPKQSTSEEKRNKILNVTIKNDQSQRKTRRRQYQYKKYLNALKNARQDFDFCSTSTITDGSSLTRKIPGKVPEGGVHSDTQIRHSGMEVRHSSMQALHMNESCSSPMFNNEEWDHEVLRKSDGRGCKPGLGPKAPELERYVEREDDEESNEYESEGEVMDLEEKDDDIDGVGSSFEERKVSSIDSVFSENVHTVGCSLNSKFTNIILNKQRVSKLKRKEKNQERRRRKKEHVLVV